MTINPVRPFWNGGERAFSGQLIYGTLNVRKSPTSESSTTDSADAQARIQEAAQALVDAFGELTITKATPNIGPSSAAIALASIVRGRVARELLAGGAPSRLSATRAVNTQTSTNRASNSSLGLDRSTAVSSLRSAILGLDRTSAGRPSALNSAAALGLDVTSPAAASLLASSRAIGLDLSSPIATSVLSSASALGLDLTSPETASRLYSAALGLDLTSPDAVSKLRSALSLGLDITSAETVSRLASSGVLGLDVTTPLAASTLRSSGTLGLDVTSPSAASLVRSAAVLGLDLTSPNRASKLTSSATVGLDVTSAQTPSSVSSVALGLDLTSPNAASKLSSSGTLGIDITSPQKASTLDSSASLGLDITSAQTSSVLSSSAVLGLDVTSPQAASTITSLAAVSTATTSYQPSVAFSSGTSVATLSGTFTGVNTAAGMSGLTIKMMNNVTVSATTANSVHFQIYDQTNTKLLDYTGNLKAGDRIYLGDDIGLYVSWSAGTAVGNATGTSTVSHSAPVVDTTAAFNAAPNSRPVFDEGATVSAGSFTINGTAITVAASDSISSVITKINSSAAGVTAVFANNKLKLTSNANSEDNIFLANDTSGFLQAMKLVAPNEEINTSTTSVGSNTLTFSGGSSVVGTLTGTYLGVGAYAGATSLTIKYTGVLASLSTTTATTIKFNVLDQNNKTLSSFSGAVKAGDKILLDNDAGLYVSFSTGSFLVGDSATTTVSSTTKTDVDPTATFNNANLNLRPRFENGAQVTAGSFTVNGVSIAVAANDSINSVLAKINASAAGATATFANDRITITNNSGTNPTILANDTSGFLAATKLAAAVTVKGNIRDDLQVLSKTTQFAGVANGTLTINGAAIVVNKDTDSVSSIIAKINASAAGVSAAYDSTKDKIVLTSLANSEDLITVSDTSGFATAGKLSTNNTVRGNIRDDQQFLAKTTQFGTVATGQFTINGATISVNKDTDTVSSIIARINASAAGVTASFDAVANKLHLVTNANSEDLITVAGDTSGFLTAAKWATANTVKGNIRDDQQYLAKTTQFGSVATGSFQINGTTISVNKDTDTLTSVIARINASGAGVTAAYNSSLDKLVLTGTVNSEDLITVGNDTAGFLTAAKLATGNTVRGHLSEDTVALYDLSRYSTVVNGSFVLDGKTINVSTTDTIQSIVSRINASGARATAAFNATTNKIVLTSTYNNEDLIPVGSDTSGFLAASGISSANTVKGNIRDDQQVLAKTTQFGTVTSGSFSINGTAIAFDRNSDTVSSILARINASAAGVVAAYDSTADKVTLTNTVNNEELITVADSTGFMNALHLSTNNTVRGHLSEDGVALRNLANFQTVTNGSFVVDGKTIAVSTNDSVNDIVARINASGARVTAQYDTVADKLVLRTTYNNEDLVPVGSDTSGFLAAAHVDAANTIRGNLPDDQQVLSKTSQFGTVTNDSFTINGAAVAVNATTDTLQSIIGKINASSAGVTASYDSVADRIVLRGNSPSEDLITIAGDTSGFAAAAKLATANTVKGNLRDDQQVLAKTSQFGSVASGSFRINGATIAVDRNTDTLSSVIAKINASAAGVTASYDSTADVIRLATIWNTEDQIVIDQDTAGFGAASKLASSNTVRGNIRDDQQVLSRTTQFGSVATGTFQINGVSIAVNKDTDTLTSVIAKINAANTGVTASFDSAANKIVLTGTSASEDLIQVTNDTTGFLGAAHLAAANTERGHLREDGVALQDIARFQGVTNGSFVVDGHTIAVNTATDSINSIVAKINASGAGVVANFDSTTGKIALQTLYATEDALAIGTDTSGFLAAAGVDPANTLRGNIRDDRQVLSKMSQFAGVQSGTFTVNGVAVTIDASTDTLTDVITKINNANAGVSAAYDATNDVLRLTATTGTQSLIAVDNDQTGFLTAAYLDPNNTVRGHMSENGVALQNIDQFAGVSNGSFTVDGRTITVDVAHDSIDSIVNKINASSARVIASYDASTDGIRLQATYNSEDVVPIGNDTTGFLSAVYLDSANTIRGNVRDDQQVLAKTTQFSGVRTGSFTINGTSIAVDANADSLTDIIARINLSNAGVTAAYDSTADLIRLVGTANSEDLITVGNDTTGFLSAGRLDSANTIRGNIADDAQVLSKTSQFGAVRTGSFTVNGVAINVDTTTDTIVGVVNKINAANAGVSAAYDASSDRIVLVNTTAGHQLVAVGNDTTGLLAATGLATSNGIAGHVIDAQEAFRYSSHFAGVQDGAFFVNGQRVDVSSANDSLQSIITRVNASGAGVTAAYDQANDIVRFIPNTAGATLDLSGDTSGFLAAVAVNQGVAGTRANISASFNGIGLASPLFDPGLSVHAGSFTVNGVQIDVDATDSVSSVLAKIGDSDAGVTGTYDAQTERVTLTSKTNTSDPVVIARDTSGFVAAVKLDSAQSSIGGTSFDSALAPLATMSEYDGVHAGVLSVNGHKISIDPNTTSVRSVVESLNGVPGVLATLDNGNVTIEAKSGGGLRLADTSGILAAFGISATQSRAHVTGTVTQQTETSNAASVAQDVARAAQMFNIALSSSGVTGSEAQQALSGVTSLLSSIGLRGLSIAGGSSSPHLAVNGQALASSIESASAVLATQLSPNSAYLSSVKQLLDSFALVAGESTSGPDSSWLDAVKASWISG